MALEFDWDEGNVGHIARHGVNPEEAGQTIRNDPLDPGAQTVDGEERFVSPGLTNRGEAAGSGDDDAGAESSVVTANGAGRKLALLYAKEKGL